jgi:GNAT superfamily N-acetyltransferase
VDVVVRAAVVADAEAIARAHVLAWQAAYAGLMPAHYLDALDVDRRIGQWRRLLTAGAERATVLVAVADAEVAGFASYGPARDDPGSSDGELYAVNVRPDRWNSGVGSVLLSAVHAGLADLGYTSAVLWVVTGNHRARTVYQRRNWRHDGVRRTAEIADFTVPELRYRRQLP